jgi:hypothetical protein
VPKNINEGLTVVSHKAYYAIMRVTLSIPDPIAEQFRAAIRPRRRSRVVTRLIVEELNRRNNTLAAACRSANRDRALQREIDDWQSFDDGVQE